VFEIGSFKNPAGFASCLYSSDVANMKEEASHIIVDSKNIK